MLLTMEVRQDVTQTSYACSSHESQEITVHALPPDLVYKTRSRDFGQHNVETREGEIVGHVFRGVTVTETSRW